MVAFKPTAEQDAVRTAFETGDHVVVTAMAGTGKTATLNLCALTQPDRRMTYVAFNRAIADEAARRFPKNVTCQPGGTLVRVPVPGGGSAGGVSWREVPIEELADGDRVVSWNNVHGSLIRKRGCFIETASRTYAGPLIAVSAAERVSRYTPEHRCVVHVSPAFEGRHLVYLMRRGGWFRVGMVEWNSQTSGRNGLIGRCYGQGAEELWVLGAYTSRLAALAAEKLTQYRYRLPGWQFRDRTMLDVKLWDEIDLSELKNAAEACLADHGRSLDSPLWREGDRFEQGPLVTPACNLMDGMHVLVADLAEERPIREGAFSKLSAPLRLWQPIQVEPEWYEGRVYSLDVETDHTYIADGIVTHNCKTMHAFAFAAVGKRFSERLNAPRVRPAQIAEILRLPERFEYGTLNLQRRQLAHVVMGGVGNFCHSADDEPDLRHVVDAAPPGLDSPEAALALGEALLPYVRKAWDDLKWPGGQLRFTHDCQPAGTMVRLSTGVGGRRAESTDVPIEQVREGDLVVSWSGKDRMGHVRRSGRRVTAVGSRLFSGDLVDLATARGRRSSCTPEHICVVRLDCDLDDGNHVVYLARRDGQFRVGRTTWRTRSQANTLGIRRRAGSQGADAVWVLSVHASDAEAALAEAAVAHRFGIPTWQFCTANETMPLDRFWSMVGDNSAAGKDCLVAYGRDIRYPLWAPETEAGWQSVRRPLFVRACNLMSGMQVCEPDEIDPHPSGSLFCNDGSGAWSSVSVSRRPFEGEVYFLDVDQDHTYVADGIVTHNCYLKLYALQQPSLPGEVVMLDEAQDADPVIKQIVESQDKQQLYVGDSFQQIYQWRGAIDALSKFEAPHRLPLQQSFRFGPAIAAEANRALLLLGSDLRVVGTPSIDSHLAHLFDPDTILTRTNSEAISLLMRAQMRNVRAGLVGGTGAVESLAKAAQDLASGIKTSHPELLAFDTWAQVQEFVSEDKDAKELATLVKLVDTHGPETLLAAVQRAVPEQHAQLVISTAHKAKGREWSRVRLAEDFPHPFDPETGDLDRGEMRLAYVAITRAKSYLDSTALGWAEQVSAAFSKPGAAEPGLGGRIVLDADEVPDRPEPDPAEAGPEPLGRPGEHLVCDPIGDGRLLFVRTRYDASLVAGQKELPGSQFYGEYQGEERVRAVRACPEALELAARHGLVVAPEARERVSDLAAPTGAGVDVSDLKV